MDLAISIQAAKIAEGSTTIPKGSTAKWPEVRGSMKYRSLKERFADKVDAECSAIFWNGTRCKEWTGTTTKSGYGQIHSDGVTVYAHRVAWELENGSPGNFYVLHRCDNRKCVNTEHLFLGTFDDNMADMMAKNRQAYGERSGHAKLTDDQVIAIKVSNEKQSVLAARYGIRQSYVSRLRSGKSRKSWRRYSLFCGENRSCPIGREPT